MHKILVIDDEKPTLTMFRPFLETYGYNVLTAASGEEGLAVFEREKPSIVLTDIKMPQMDGIEVLKAIKTIAPRTEVIVITGHGDMDLAIQALNLDAADFINKPIKRRALEQALARAEERLRLRKSKAEEIRTALENGTVWIRIQGMVNAASEDTLQQAYQEALAHAGERIVISLADHTSVNGAGLAILAQLLLKAGKEGQSVLLVAPSLNLRSIFHIVGISKLVQIYENEASALADAADGSGHHGEMG